MRIDCLKYEWTNVTDTIEVNFFSDVSTPDLITTIDLFDFYIDGTMSEVEYKFEHTDEKNILYGETSNFSLSVINDNLISDTLLFDFFEIFETNRYLKWKVNLYDDDDILIYSGILYKDQIKCDDIETQILQLSILGYEKEFKDYFSNKTLVPSDDINKVPNPVNLDMDGIELMKVFGDLGIFNENFENVNMVFKIPFSVHYFIMEWGYTYAPYADMLDMPNMFHVKTGYRNFADSGVSRFDFFSGLLQGMGWLWYFYLGTLYVRRRHEPTTLLVPTLTLDADNFKAPCPVDSTLHNKCDVVVITDGEYYGSLTSFELFTGLRACYYSEIIKYYNYQRPMYSLYYATSNYSFNNGNWTFSKVDDENDKQLNAGVYNVVQPAKPVKTSNNQYPSSRYFRLAPIVNSREYSNGLDTNNPRGSTGAYFGNGNFISIALSPHTTSQFFYTGNPASAIIQRVGTKWRGYESYCNTDDFKNNIKTLLRNAISVNISPSTKDFITNPVQNFNVINFPDAYLAGKVLFLSRLAFHPIEQETNLTLQSIQ